jgi:hypothetical protein
MTYSAIIEKYLKHQRFKEEVILKKITDDTNVAKLFTLTCIKNLSDHSFHQPWKLKEQIARDIQKYY